MATGSCNVETYPILLHRSGDWKLIVGRAGVFNRWYPVMGDHVHDTDFEKDKITDNSTYMLFNIKGDGN